ncbi:hypothetical protein [Acinetobacter nectaris]|uniref:hypothetical protein n=1 Tax=Acinetobacter nectaris TaxID=1219382 RepID=UPI001F179565|nr:hypothetical protein [Acinetobacter nectaris]
MFNKQILCFAVMCLGLQTSFAAISWPPETGAKVVGNALEYPTTLSGQQKSMTDFLNHGAKIINTQMGELDQYLHYSKERNSYSVLFILLTLKRIRMSQHQNVMV